LFGTTLLFFGNCISSHPEHAEPGEPPSGIPFWIAALDIFETGENSPGRFSGNTSTSTYGGSVFWDRVVSPREDWLMAIMWGRTLVALADAMLERNKLNPPPPKPQHFPSPFPVNTDYLKTGTIWDEEPEWPVESPLGVIVNRRPPISRRMALGDATPHEILQLARDHITRGMFRMPRHGASPFLPPDSEHPAAPLFTRTRILYDTGYPILLAAEQLNDYDERKEWFSYAESIFYQIRLASPRHDSQVHERASFPPLSGSRPDVSSVPESISDGEIETVHGRAWVLIGSSIAEDLEGTMEDDNDDETAQISPVRQQKAAEARNALHRGIDLVQNAISRIKDEPSPVEEEGDVDTAYEYDIFGGDDLMLIPEVENGEDSDDDKRMRESHMSPRARGKQPAESDLEALRNARVKNKRISVIAARLRREQEAEIEKAERIRLLEEGYISLANVAYLTKNKEEEDKYLRLAELVKGEGIDGDEDMEDAN
jgi:hypothetical protein